MTDERDPTPGADRDAKPAESDRGPMPVNGSPSSTRAKAAVVLAAVFVLGAAAGGAVGRITALRDFHRIVDGPPAEARANFRLEAMRRHLDLTDDQVARMRVIMSEADTERDSLMATCGPGLEDLRQRTEARMRDVLTAQQRTQFDELHARHGRPHGPWPGGPRPGGPRPGGPRPGGQPPP